MSIPVQSSFTFAPVAKDAPLPRRNIVIEAGAGTGKTTAIVAEVLELLLGDEALQPERIVLVTFTEKAAGEIADRIHQALTEIELRFAGDGEIAWPIGSSHPLFTVPHGRKEEYRRACAAQLARIDSLRSQTIHSFCQSLLRQFPIEAGLDPQFTIIEGFERSLLHGEVYDAWIDDETRLHPTPETRHDWEVLIERVSYLFLIREIIFALIERRDLLIDDSYDLGALDLVEHELLIAIERLRGCDVDALGGICDYLRAHPSPRRGSEIETWIEYLKPIANEIRTTDLPKGRKAEFNDAVRVLRADKDKGNSVHDRLVSHRAAVALLALTRRFLAFLGEEKRKRGVVDFDDLLLRTLAVLGDEAVLERVRDQFDYIFVDEFQDTDRVQERIIDKLARDRYGAFIDGKTVVVGDPKQSIYGFRRADPETYDAFTRSMIEAGAEHRIITDQYRSDPPLLDVINALFTSLFADSAQDPNVFRPAYHRLTAAVAAKQSSPKLDAHITILNAEFEEKSEKPFAEAEAIAAWINERRGADDDLRRFALLFRRTTKLDDYLDVLERRGIDYVLPPTRLFLDRPAPVDLLAILRAIAYPFDRGAEISAARSPYFALTDVEIARGVLAPEETDGSPYATFKTSLAGFRDAAQHLTVSQLIDLVIRTCGMEEVYAAAADGRRSMRHLEHLRAIAFNYDQRLGGSVRQFVNEIGRRRTDPDEMEPSLVDEASNAVRILTVHAAKGLEFDTVILPDLEFPSKSPEIFLVDEPRSLVLRGQVETLSSHYGRAGDRPLKEIGSMREEAENRRLFYVAVTRARREVVFVMNARPRNEGFARYAVDLFSLATASWPPAGKRTVNTLTIAGKSVPVAFETMGSSATAARTRRRLADAALETELASSAVDCIVPQPEAVAGVLDRGDALSRRASSRKRSAGILLHRVLERWDATSPVEPLLSALAAEEGAPGETLSLVRQRLATVAKSETFRRIARAQTLGRELALAFLDDGGNPIEKRIDRLIAEDGHDTVIDYKSGEPAPERLTRDREQVALYCRAMSRIRSRPCKGLLWYIDVDVDRAFEV